MAQRDLLTQLAASSKLHSYLHGILGFDESLAAFDPAGTATPLWV